jgi:hypothetical protein
MNWFTKARSLNAAVAVLAALAWFTASHHCLLGLITQPHETAVPISHCPAHCPKSDAKSPSQPGMLACCQGLLSSHAGVAKAKISFTPVLAGIQLFAIGHLVLSESPRRILPSTEYDTGPPSAGSFVEIVLQRSLRENAPPRLS